MKIFAKSFAVSLLIACAAPTRADTAAISEVSWGQDWPFTVPAGELQCKALGELHLVTFTANGTKYAVNGTARSRLQEYGLKDSDEIWKREPKHPEMRVSSNIVKEGIALCGKAQGTALAGVSSPSAPPSKAAPPQRATPAPTPQSSSHESGGNPLAAVFGILLLILFVGAFFSSKKKCSVCGIVIKKKSYTWEVNGKKEIMCPNCNSRMENKRSREEFSRRFR